MNFWGSRENKEHRRWSSELRFHLVHLRLPGVPGQDKGQGASASLQTSETKPWERAQPAQGSHAEWARRQGWETALASGRALTWWVSVAFPPFFQVWWARDLIPQFHVLKLQQSLALLICTNPYQGRDTWAAVQERPVRVEYLQTRSFVLPLPLKLKHSTILRLPVFRKLKE